MGSSTPAVVLTTMATAAMARLGHGGDRKGEGANGQGLGLGFQGCSSYPHMDSSEQGGHGSGDKLVRSSLSCSVATEKEDGELHLALCSFKIITNKPFPVLCRNYSSCLRII